MKHNTLFWIAILAGALSALAFVTIAAAAASDPITGGSSFGTAVKINPDTEYSASINNTSHTSDYFYFDPVPGEIVTMVFTSTTTFKSATFYLYDQNHVTYLAYQAVNGTEQTYRFAYMGNNSTPTKYYFVVMSPGAGTNAYTFQYEVEAQADGGSPGDAGDVIATAKEITPGVDTTYTDNLLGFADHDDWYKISAVSGQIVTMTLTYPTYDGVAPIPTLRCIVYDQSGTTVLSDKSLYPPSGTPAVFQWMSNNTRPSAYYLHLYVNTYKGLAHYTLQVQLDQQDDANRPGDAGDDFDTARSVIFTSESPSLYATHNLLGASDSIDYYLVKLPTLDPYEPPVRYRYWIAPVHWPAESGHLTITLYDALRNQIPSLGGTINAPSMNTLSGEITACGSTGCYVKVTTGFTGYYQFQYSIHFAPIQLTYLPFLIR
jgi:hypothetical protein